MSAKPTFIDLFCGCGGFTLGMLRAGFDCKAAIDFNSQAVATLKVNLAEAQHSGFSPVEHALERDLTQFPPKDLEKLLGTNRLDVIVGGPPCQGFSTARQRDGSNHGEKRLKADPRRHLFRNFLDYVEFFQPKVFVIENVLGLRSAGGGQYFTAVQHEARVLGRAKGLPGYRVHPQIERGEKLGVPQKRRRQLIVGVRNDLPGYFDPELTPAPRATIGVMLGDAILDLPSLDAGQGEHQTPYDIRRRLTQFLGGTRDHLRQPYLQKVAEAPNEGMITNHEARPHSARDLRDFLRLDEGESSATAMKRGVTFDFPYDKTSFKDRYTRQHRNRPCSTIVAHLSKDGLMFIHPVQNRSLTPREAARVQTFPDWFLFPRARTHSFRLIGNAVPPLIGEAVGLAVRRFLTLDTIKSDQKNNQHRARRAVSLPSTPAEAAERLNRLMNCDRKQLRSLPTANFVSGWHSLLWLFPGLHPDNALDHGTETLEWPEAATVLPGIDPSRRQVHLRSGWPVALCLIGEEAWRRYRADEIADEILYCSDAQRAGLNAHHGRHPASVV